MTDRQEDRSPMLPRDEPELNVVANEAVDVEQMKREADPEEMKRQIQQMIAKHGRDRVSEIPMEVVRDDQGRFIIRELPDAPPPPPRPRSTHLISSMYGMYAAEEQERQAERRRRLVERQERVAQREADHRRALEQNLELATEMLRAAQKPLRWTQIVQHLDGQALEGIRAQLKNNPRIAHTKRGKHTYLEWRD